MKIANGDLRYEKVDLDDHDSDSSDSSRGSTTLFRSHRSRFALLGLMLFLSSFSNNVVIAFLHDKVPAYKPLPDLFFGVFEEAPGLLKMTEVCILLSAALALIVIFCNKKRWIIACRVAFIASLLYLGRAVCFSVTVLPVASPNFACDSHNRTTYSDLLRRISGNFFALGIETSGMSTACGDYIYSGHTVVTVMASLVMREYSPKRLRPWLPLGMYCITTLTLFGILITRLHYTIDVILAYFLTTRLFWTYHMCVAVRGTNRVPQRGDIISTFLWYPFVDFIESD